LVETNQQERFDKIIVVDVPFATQLSRLILRDHSDEKEARAILASQASREDRLAIADYIIDNSGLVEDTENTVETLHRNLVNLNI